MEQFMISAITLGLPLPSLPHLPSAANTSKLEQNSLPLDTFKHNFKQLGGSGKRFQDEFEQLDVKLTQKLRLELELLPELANNLTELISEDGQGINLEEIKLKEGVALAFATFKQVIEASIALKLNPDQKLLIDTITLEFETIHAFINSPIEIPNNLKRIITGCYSCAEKPQKRRITVLGAACCEKIEEMNGKRLTATMDPELDGIFQISPFDENDQGSVLLAKKQTKNIRKELSEIINNCLVNAATHGDYHIFIDSKWISLDDSDQGHLVITIWEYGEGIVKDYLSKTPDQVNKEAFRILTEPRVQGSSTSSGSGLGGASILQLITELHATLDILTRGGRSPMGEKFDGTKITISIPYTKTEGRIPHIDADEVMEKIGTIGLNALKKELELVGLQIIVAEDNPLNLKVVVSQLKRALKSSTLPPPDISACAVNIISDTKTQSLSSPNTFRSLSPLPLSFNGNIESTSSSSIAQRSLPPPLFIDDTEHPSPLLTASLDKLTPLALAYDNEEDEIPPFKLKPLSAHSSIRNNEIDSVTTPKSLLASARPSPRFISSLPPISDDETENSSSPNQVKFCSVPSLTHTVDSIKSKPLYSLASSASMPIKSRTITSVDNTAAIDSVSDSVSLPPSSSSKLKIKSTQIKTSGEILKPYDEIRTYQFLNGEEDLVKIKKDIDAAARIGLHGRITCILVDGEMPGILGDRLVEKITDYCETKGYKNLVYCYSYTAKEYASTQSLKLYQGHFSKPTKNTNDFILGLSSALHSARSRPPITPENSSSITCSFPPSSRSESIFSPGSSFGASFEPSFGPSETTSCCSESSFPTFPESSFPTFEED